MPKLLVVDDNLLALRFFSEALATLGIDCVTAVDARSALAASAAAAFDLLLIDARLPDQPGTAVLAAIRNGNGPSRTAPALATTAAGDSAGAALLVAGFAAVITKPVHIETLRAALAAHAILPATTGLLDDRQAIAGEPAILTALRGLFAAELDALPGELDALVRAGDRDGLRERLHRLAASAGFCGAVPLGAAITELQRALAMDAADRAAAVGEILAVVRATRRALAGPAS